MAKKAHIVDVLIDERAGDLLRVPLLGTFLRFFFYPIMGYYELISVIDRMSAAPSAIEAMRIVCDDIPVRMSVRGAEYIPAQGSAIIVSNHPSGMGDGLALYQLMMDIRRDFVFFANRDLIRAVNIMHEMIIPVEWREEIRTRANSKETVAHTLQAIREQRLIVIFPSGRLAKGQLLGNKITERPWNETAVRLARKYQLPIIPMHITSRNSKFFYLIASLSTQIRDIAIVHEMFNKKGELYEIDIAPAVLPEQLVGDSKQLSDQLRAYVDSYFEPALALDHCRNKP